MSLVCQPSLRLTECASELAVCNAACVQRWFKTRGAQVVHKFESHLKVLGAGRVIGSMFHIEDPQTLGSTLKY